MLVASVYNVYRRLCDDEGYTWLSISVVLNFLSWTTTTDRPLLTLRTLLLLLVLKN